MPRTHMISYDLQGPAQALPQLFIDHDQTYASAIRGNGLQDSSGRESGDPITEVDEESFALICPDH